MPKVSIVIPVYNMEKYLSRCMESVLAQTLSDIEIILVDDGGTDRSVQMCDDYAGKDARVKVLHKPNGGLTSAWKAGSSLATGDYIGYVDSDDFIAPNMYEVLYARAVSEDADIVCCGLRHVYESGNHKEWTEQMMFPRDVFTVEELKEEMFPVLINDGSFMGRHLMPNRVTKLVRAELVKANLQNCDDAVSIGEDFQFSLCMFLDAKKVVIVKDFFPYYYWMNDGSMTMQYDSGYMKKIQIMRENLLRISKKKGGYDFSGQIDNDYVCLTVLNVKGCVYKQKGAPYRKLRQDMASVCEEPVTKEILAKANMGRLSVAEKLFLFFMKNRLYFLIYLAVRIYFR